MRYLETRTAHYWQDRHSAVVAAPVLLSYVLEHLRRLLTFLERPLFPSERSRLCTLASETAQLIGDLFFELADYSQARSFHQQAIRAAQEADHPALEATAWGRLSFAWTYSGNPQKALFCTQQARSLAEGKSSQIVQAFLCAIEAEVQALLNNRGAALKALDDAERLERLSRNTEEHPWLHFDHARLEGYRGICFRYFYYPKKSQTTAFLAQAQKALEDALNSLLPSMLHHRPTLLIDLASIYTQQGEVEAACAHALQATTILAQMRSGVGTQRLLALRRDLAPWRDTTYVKNLDEVVATLLVPERRSGA
ncbi:MAG: hypothetical protein IMW89_14695 [Ktedonobacteraceae bacterium]|nr:hypothetical protein [Ktedonobacteraceae bacterium]